MSRILSVVKNLDGKILSPSELAQNFIGGNAMILALQKRCPPPSPFLRVMKLPEPKFVTYREELDGNSYRQSIQTMKPSAWFRVSKHVDASYGVNAALTMRMIVRADLLQRFWRRLGAA